MSNIKIVKPTVQVYKILGIMKTNILLLIDKEKLVFI